MRLVEIAIEVEHLEQRPRVKRLDRAAIAAHGLDARHAIGAESQRVQQARRRGLGRNLLRPAVLHFDFLAARELAVELRRRAADFIRLVFAARERGFDNAAIGVGGEVDGCGVERLVAEDLRARQAPRCVAAHSFAGGWGTPSPFSNPPNSHHTQADQCHAEQRTFHDVLAKANGTPLPKRAERDRLTFAAHCGNLHSTRHRRTLTHRAYDPAAGGFSIADQTQKFRCPTAISNALDVTPDGFGSGSRNLESGI